MTNFFPPFGYGYGAICRDVMRGLGARGHDVRVLCAAGGEHEKAIVVERSLAHLPAAWRRPAAGLRAERVVQRAVHEALTQGVDAAIAWHMRGIGKGALTLLHRRGIPVVYALGDLWVVYERPGPPSAWRAWSALDERASYRRIRAAAGALGGAMTGLELRPPPIATEGRVAFASDWLSRRYAEAGFRPRHSSIVPNGVDLSLFAEVPPRRDARRALFVGRVDRSKGADVAVSAVAADPDLTLTMIGGVDPGIATAVAASGAGERIVLLGEQPRDVVLERMRDHDLFLMPGRIEEGFGMVYLEAMAAGLPIVGTAAGGAAEFCRDGENALVVAPAAAAVGEAVRRLRADHVLRDRLVAEGRRTAERYSLSATVDAFAALAAA